MFKNWTYKRVKKHAKALKEIGFDDIYLDNGPYPWEHVIKCESGGSHRLGMYTNFWFTAIEPGVDIEVRWSFNIEPQSANGSGTYQIDSLGCEEVMGKLNGKARKMFQDYLLECGSKVKHQARELHEIVEKLSRDANVLLVLGRWKG